MENFATNHAQSGIDVVFMNNAHVTSYLTSALAEIECELDHARRVPLVVSDEDVSRLEASYDDAQDQLSAELRFAGNYDAV